MADVLGSLAHGFAISLAPGNLLACFLGVLVGTVIGLLPGLGPVATMSLLLPLTIRMDATAAIIVMAGVFYGAMYSGSTTAILLNIPGEAASVVSCLDGYRMAQQGRAGPALALCVWGSFAAGTLGVIGITLLAPPLAQAALAFGPVEITAVLLLSFVLVVQFSEGSRARGLAMVLLGFLLSTIGQDPVDATPRFAFGTFTLLDGIGFTPLVVGLFGVSEVLLNLRHGAGTSSFAGRITGLWPTRRDWGEAAGPIARGSVLGFFLGILPGMGAIVPTFISYSVERRLSRHPERFGHGAVAGLAGPESANNAATAGAMVPLLTLGIAPSAAVAVLTAAFLTHGVQPGPLFIVEKPDMFWGVVTSMYTGNVLLVLLNLPLVGLWVRLLTIPYRYLFPLILLICVIGTYSVENNPWDVVLMAAFGVVGYALRTLDYPAAPLILAFVLGRLLEQALRQSLVLSRGSVWIFVAHPIALALLVVTALLVALPLVRRGRWLAPAPEGEP